MATRLKDLANREPSLLTLRRLNATFVAEVEGIDLGGPLSDETIAAIGAAMVEHKLLVFRRQRLTPIAQRSFAARFGELHVHPLNLHAPGVPEIMVLDWNEKNRLENSTWHTDVTFIETPPLGSILHAVELPPTGGDTIFADQAAAYAALSEPVRRLLDGLSATHDFQKSFTAERYATPEGRAKWLKTRETHPPVNHPMVRTHPVSGQKGLFANEGFTISIDGVSRDESRAILGLIFDHATRPSSAIATAGSRATCCSGTTASPSTTPSPITGRTSARCSGRPSSATGRSERGARACPATSPAAACSKAPPPSAPRRSSCPARLRLLSDRNRSPALR